LTKLQLLGFEYSNFGNSKKASAAVGKEYAQRPASYKGSLSLQMDRFTYRKKDK